MSRNNYAGKEITKTLNLYGYINDWKLNDDDDNYNFTITVGEVDAGTGYIHLGTMDVTMTVPDVDIDACAITSMREEQQRISAEAQLKVNNIEETIQSLLCLPQPKGEVS